MPLGWTLSTNRSLTYDEPKVTHTEEEQQMAKPKKTANATNPRPAAPPPDAQEQRNHFIAVAAYYIAERRGFDGGDPGDDWTQAEREIDRLLAEGHFNQ